ncbi:hypothetical protein PUN28_001612 [Cardiocondyla obscurior]|uniref:Uncharacterized protein n=1 Tax=Cardiocondyla obscurior TaxID=286306 RepID=A0AAW2GQC0_9HYME
MSVCYCFSKKSRKMSSLPSLNPTSVSQSCLASASKNANCLLEFDNSSSPRCKIHEAILEL